jgi:hypothetical protein
MTDEQQAPASGRASSRIIEGLILAGILGLVGMVIQQGKDSARADNERSAQIATLQSQVANLQAMLLGLPDLTTRMTRAEMNITDLQRRQDLDDKWREASAVKRWTR